MRSATRVARCSARRSSTARSSTTRSRAPPTSRWAGGASRPRASTACRIGGGERAFDYGVALTAWKRFTHPSFVPLTRATSEGGSVTVVPVVEPAPPVAFLGVRACELAALGIQDRAMRAGPVGDADHAARRDAALVVAVECASATSTCFCTSMGTGPEVRDGADLVLAELDDGFTVRAGSPAGAAILERLDLPAATDADDARGDRPGRRRPRDASATRSRPRASRSGSAARSTTRAGPRSPSGAWRAPTAPSCARPASARA